MLRIIILIVAIGAGSLAAWLALNMKPGVAVTAAPAPAPVAMTEVLVASTDLAQGQTISNTTARWQTWPEQAVSAGFITRSAKPDALKTLEGSMVRSHFVSGEPINEGKLSRGSNLLSSVLSPGKRAVAIRISVESTAGGFILPNDRVDVIQTVARPGEGQTENLSRTILTNIRVLAVDQKVDSVQKTDEGKGGEAKGGAVAMGKTATLELSPSQVETIAAGQATGILSLALRSIADSNDETVLSIQNSPSVRILRAGRSEVVKF